MEETFTERIKHFAKVQPDKLLWAFYNDQLDKVDSFTFLVWAVESF
jgi:hypothetical protein